MIFASLGSLTSSIFVLPLIHFFSGSDKATGEALAYGYRCTNIVLGLAVVIIMFICVFSIAEINPPTIEKKEKKSSFIQDMGNVFNSKYYIIILLLVYFLFVGYLGMYAAMQYYYKYIIGNETGMTIALSLLTILAIPTMLLAAYLNGKGVHKVKLMQFGAIVDAIGYGILFFTSNGTVATAALGLIGLGFGFRSGIYYAMLPDVFDYTEYKCGKSLAGTQTAVSGFLNKVASASASAIISALLVWGAYNADALDAVVAAGQKVADVYPQTATAINFAFGGLSMVSTIICIIVLIPYDLDKKYPEIRAELDRRQAEK
jgi:GPH family glycoside/pentoside/hexuronide:cation symporter